MSVTTDLASIVPIFQRAEPPAEDSTVVCCRHYVQIGKEKVTDTGTRADKSPFAEVTAFFKNVICNPKGCLSDKRKILGSFKKMVDGFTKSANQDILVRIINFVFGEKSSLHGFFNTRAAKASQYANVISEGNNSMHNHREIFIRDHDEFVKQLPREFEEEFNKVYQAYKEYIEKEEYREDEFSSRPRDVKQRSIIEVPLDEMLSGVINLNNVTYSPKFKEYLNECLEKHLKKERTGWDELLLRS